MDLNPDEGPQGFLGGVEPVAKVPKNAVLEALYEMRGRPEEGVPPLLRARDGNMPGDYLDTLTPGEAKQASLQAKMDAAIAKHEGATLADFRTPSGPADEDGRLAEDGPRHIMGPGVRMAGDGEHWSGGVLGAGMSDQERAVFAQARQAGQMQVLGMRRANEEQAVEAKARKADVEALRGEIRDLQRRKRRVRSGLQSTARDVTGSRSGAKRFDGFIRGETSKIEARIADIRREIDQGGVEARSLAGLARSGREQVREMERSVDESAMAAVYDLRAAGAAQQAQQAQQDFEQRLAAEMYGDEQALAGQMQALEARQYADEQGAAQRKERATQRETQIGYAMENIAQLEAELKDENQNLTPAAKAKKQNLLREMKEALFQLRSGDEVAQLEAAGYDEEQIAKILAEKARRNR